MAKNNVFFFFCFIFHLFKEKARLSLPIFFFYKDLKCPGKCPANVTSKSSGHITSNDFLLTSMRCHVASTSVRRHFDIIFLLGTK